MVEGRYPLAGNHSSLVSILVMARLAGLAGLAELSLGGIEIAALRDFGKLGGLRLHLFQLVFEIVHVEPDFGLCFRFTVLGTRKESFERKFAHVCNDFGMA